MTNTSGKLFHVVSLKFKNTATKEHIKAVEDAFFTLKDKIPEIVTLTGGTNVSVEQLDKGFTHCFVLTFNNDKDRDTYLTHPDHVLFGGIVIPVREDVFVMDFFAK